MALSKIDDQVKALSIVSENESNQAFLICWCDDFFQKHRPWPNFFFYGGVLFIQERISIGEQEDGKATTGRRTKARGPREWRFRWDDEPRSVGLRRLSLPVRRPRSYPIEYTQSPDFPVLLASPLSSFTRHSFPIALHGQEFACTSDPRAFVN